MIEENMELIELFAHFIYLNLFLLFLYQINNINKNNDKSIKGLFTICFIVLFMFIGSLLIIYYVGLYTLYNNIISGIGYSIGLLLIYMVYMIISKNNNNNNNININMEKFNIDNIKEKITSIDMVNFKELINNLKKVIN